MPVRSKKELLNYNAYYGKMQPIIDMDDRSTHPTPDQQAIASRLLEISKELTNFKDIAESGGISKRGLFQPKYQADEQLWLRVPQLVYGKLPKPAAGEDIDTALLEQRRGSDGTLYITNRRLLLVGNWGKILHEWRWDGIARVRIIPEWRGIQLITDDTGAEVLLHHHIRRYLFNATKREIALPYLKIQAASILAKGQDFSAWLRDLPQYILGK